MRASFYLQSGLLNHILRGSTFTKPGTIAIALCRDVPSENQNGGNIPEISNAGGYARVNLGAPANGTWNEVTAFTAFSGLVDNVSAINFPVATANWGYASGIAVLDSGVYGSGNLLLYGPLTTARDIQNTDQFTFSAGNLDIICG